MLCSALGATRTTAAQFKATRSACRALKPVEDDASASLQVLLADGTTVQLPAALESILLTAVRDAADGHSVAVVRSDEELSPAKAGELLGLSRQYVDRLIAEGALPARRLPGSTHRKVRVTDVLAFGPDGDERRARHRRVHAGEPVLANRRWRAASGCASPVRMATPAASARLACS